MADNPAALIRKQVEAHDAATEAELARLHSLTVRERAAVIESACRAAAQIARDREAAGLPPIEPEAWPASTWEFLRKHAARRRELSR